jgi:uncharacterized protein YraI
MFGIIISPRPEIGSIKMPKTRGTFVLLLIGIWGAAVLLGPRPPEAVFAQTEITSTALPGLDQAYVTNTFEEAINVRVGPSTITYPVPCGALPVGANAAALGTTPAHEWVQIQFEGCPGGVGWVYAANVTLTGAIREIEPPPTPMPLATSTFDPTLVAAFQTEPTATRLATFTPPPPLVRPTFVEATGPVGNFPAGAAILAAALIGGLVLAASFMGRR